MKLNALATQAERPEFQDDRTATSNSSMSYDTWMQYHFAAGFAAGLGRNASVLDLGSGTGEGAHLLAQSALRIWACEPDSRLVAIAQSRSENSNLTYHCADIDSFLKTLPSESIDMVTCFQHIEKLGEPVRNVILSEIKRLLKPTGRALLSASENTHFTTERWSTLLRPYFSSIEFYEQRIFNEDVEKHGNSTAILQSLHSNSLNQLKSSQPPLMIAVSQKESMAPRDEQVASLQQRVAQLELIKEDLLLLLARSELQAQSQRQMEADLAIERSEKLSERHLRIHLENMLSVRTALAFKRILDRFPNAKRFLKGIFSRS